MYWFLFVSGKYKMPVVISRATTKTAMKTCITSRLIEGTVINSKRRYNRFRPKFIHNLH